MRGEKEAGYGTCFLFWPIRTSTAFAFLVRAKPFSRKPGLRKMSFELGVLAAMLKVYILADNRVHKQGLLAEHGLSLWIEKDNTKIFNISKGKFISIATISCNSKGNKTSILFET